MSRPPRDRDEQSGAVAVTVALMAVMLMIVAALSVDLGNAWARGRVVQKQADVAAIAAGSLLPMTPANRTAIEIKAADFLNKNMSQGQTAADYHLFNDNDLANGELDFFDMDGQPNCTTGCTQMTLTPPKAFVTFGLAGLVSNGVDIVRSATVALKSVPPPMGKVVPLWLPSGCGYGPVDGDTSGGTSPSGPSAPATSSTTTTTSTATSSTSTVTATATATIAPTPTDTHNLVGTNTSVAAGQSLTIHGWQITDLGANISKASIRLISPDKTIYVEYAASTNVPKGTMSIPDFAIGTEVTNTPGVWTAYAMAQANGNQAVKYSTTSVTVTVTGSAPSTSSSAPTSATTSASASATSVPVGCVGQDRGNFGQLDSPRNDSSNKTALALNMAVGLDHRLALYDGPLTPTQKECADKNGHNNIDPAFVKLDNDTVGPNNCIIADSGNDGPAFYQGLISGVSSPSATGRLDVVNGHTKTGCGSPARADLNVNGHMINNDQLSCYLANGATLADLASPNATSDMLDQSIAKSPRLVYLPVVLANDRAQKGFQPMVGYVAGFITDEDYGTQATSSNGLTINGNSVATIRVFVFNASTIINDPNNPDQEYTPALGNPVVRLIG